MITQTAFNLTDMPKKEYNGWSDWTTWNCALWIGNDEGLFNMARNCVDYIDFINNVIDFLPKTPDGAIWDEADVFEMNEMMAEL